MKQQTGGNHIHQSILPPKNIFFMNIPTYKTRDKITITNARFLFALFDIENRFYLANLVILIDWLSTAIPEPHTIYSNVRLKRTSVEDWCSLTKPSRLTSIRLDALSIDGMEINAILTIFFRMTLVDMYPN